MFNVKSKFEKIKVSDGTEMQVYISEPLVVNKYPGLLLFQEAFGVNGHIKNVVERFASQGFIVIAPELYHRTAEPGFSSSYSDFEKLRPHMQKMSIETIQADIIAAHDWLNNYENVEKDKISSVGFCMGGRVSFLANISLNLKSAVSFYGARIAETLLDDVKEISAPHLLFWGGLDSHIKAESRNAVTEALEKNNKEFVNVVFSKGDHGFFCDERPSYNPQAARQAWPLCLEFIKSNLN